jgi:hypothetical protein
LEEEEEEEDHPETQVSTSYPSFQGSFDIPIAKMKFSAAVLALAGVANAHCTWFPLRSRSPFCEGHL